LLGNQQNLLQTKLLCSAPICTKSFVDWGFAPDPTGELTTLPHTPYIYLGPTFKGKERKVSAAEGTGGEKRRGSSYFAGG